MIGIDVKCMFCGKSLMCEARPMEARPSIRVRVSQGKARGNLYMSSRYESAVTEADVPLAEGKTAKFYCPHCERELRDARTCPRCRAPLIPMESDGGGIVLVCSRKGCKDPLVEFESLESEIREFYDTYYTFVR